MIHAYQEFCIKKFGHLSPHLAQHINQLVFQRKGAITQCVSAILIIADQYAMYLSSRFKVDFGSPRALNGIPQIMPLRTLGEPKIT